VIPCSVKKTIYLVFVDFLARCIYGRNIEHVSLKEFELEQPGESYPYSNRARGISTPLLPSYMSRAFYSTLTEVVLTDNGKVICLYKQLNKEILSHVRTKNKQSQEAGGEISGSVLK
jgi:hypothetical protein